MSRKGRFRKPHDGVTTSGEPWTGHQSRRRGIEEEMRCGVGRNRGVRVAAELSRKLK